MLLEPNYNLESIYDIDIAELNSVGIKALFCDLDSTLMKSKSGKFSFQTLHGVFRFLLRLLCLMPPAQQTADGVLP